ncbi:MAG: GmrSD restriction endonuclease domain-containing protein [Candidatus Njordarchaeia archaeon]
MHISIEILKDKLGITDSYLLPSQIPLVTLSTYLYHKNFSGINDIDPNEIENIINWFILVNFNGYYSSATDTKLNEDIEIVKSFDSFPFDELIENMEKRKTRTKISKRDLELGLKVNALKKEGRPYLFILYILLIKRNADNWAGKLLKQSSWNSIARHHIFPEEYLNKNLDIDDPDLMEIKINNIGNITFIDKKINAEIQDDPPKKYMESYRESAKKHFIPSDENLWKLDQYETFLTYRVKEIYTALKKEFPKITG